MKVQPKKYYTLATTNASLSVSPDGKLIALVNPDSTVYLYSTVGTVPLLNTYYPANTVPVNYRTGKINFDNSSSYFIVEYDSYSPITVFSIASTTPVYEFTHADTISAVSFLQSNLDYLVILGQGGNYLLDTRDSTTYSFASLGTSSVYGTDYNDKFYYCTNNVVSQVSFAFPAPAKIVNSPYYIDLQQT
jgi:WD40 repeat protein